MSNEESIPDLIKELSKSLFDPTLLKRYGTNLNPSMSLDYEKYLMKRYNELKLEFLRINKNIEDGITIDELTEFLNSYSQESGKQFSKDYAERMYNMLDLDQNKEITIQEFIFSYILLEERLRLKQIRLQKFFDELSSTKEKYNTAMLQNKNEKLNKHGIAETALLYVTVLEGKGLISNRQEPDPYVVLTIDGHKQMSTYRPESLDPIWNEDFTFTVQSKEQAIKIEVFDHDTSQGSLEIIMNDLADQQKYEGWFYLNDANGEQTITQIRLRIQFIWSRYLYFHEKCEKAVTNLNRLNEDIMEINRYLDMFNKPYGLILYAEILDLLNKKVFDDQEEIIYSMPKISRNISNIIQKNKLKKISTDKFVKKLKGEISIFTKFIVISYFIFTLSSVILRSDFLNLLLSIFFIMVFFLDKKGKYIENIKSFIYVFLITFIYDFAWIFTLGDSYYKGIKSEIIEENLTLGKVVFYLAVCTIMTKFILIFLLIDQYLKAQEVDRLIRDSKPTPEE